MGSKGAAKGAKPLERFGGKLRSQLACEKSPDPRCLWAKRSPPTPDAVCPGISLRTQNACKVHPRPTSSAIGELWSLSVAGPFTTGSVQMTEAELVTTDCRNS